MAGGKFQPTRQPSSSSVVTNFLYLRSFPGILRLLNIVLGAIALALWIPGYEHSFLGAQINSNGDTDKGYGNGYKRETLNQFVLAAIIICLLMSVVIVFVLALIRRAAVNWNRLNKLSHLALGILTLIGVICASCGVWYFQESCCHVDMFPSGSSGVAFAVNSGEGYVKHCYCYLTRVTGQSATETVTDTILYEGNKSPDNADFNDQWVFAAHHIYPHVAAILILLLNAFVYLIGSCISEPLKSKKATRIQVTPAPWVFYK